MGPSTGRRTLPPRLVAVIVAAVPWLLLAAGTARMGLALAFSQGPTGVRLGNDFVDLGVYRMGGQAILDGAPLYEAAYEIGELPFTYPPFAAVLFAPFALVPFGAAQAVMVVIGLACLWLSAMLVARHLPITLGRELPWSTPVAAAGAFGLGGMLEPTTTTLDLGQVNLILMAALLFDSLVPWRFSGALVGVASGVKIVPGVFALAMLPTRRLTEFVRACAAFIATVVVGFVVQPQQSWLYWTSLFYSDGRQASVVTILNQSLYADFVRLWGKPAGVVVWAVVGAGVLVGGIALAARVWYEDRLTAVTVVAIAGLLVSPISWNHHWVWLMPALAVAAATGVRSWGEGRRVLPIVAGAYVLVVGAVTALGPIKLAGATVGFESSWSNWLVGNSLILAGIWFLAVVWWANPREHRMARSKLFTVHSD